MTDNPRCHCPLPADSFDAVRGDYHRDDCEWWIAQQAQTEEEDYIMVVCNVCKEDDERLLGPDKRFRLYSLQAFVHHEVPIDGGIGATKSLDLCRKCLVRAMSAVERELEVEWGNIE